MNVVNIREARRRLGDIVRAAERGQSTVITRHGREIARVAPVRSEPDRELPDLTEFRASVAIKGKALSRTVIDARDRERY